MQGIVILAIFSIILTVTQGRFRPVSKSIINVTYDKENVGKPLFLTPLLEAGKYKRAQHLSKVKPDIGNMTSYSGFFTVNKDCESNLFFWFFPAQKDNWKDVPLLIWLQGGPGATSVYGLFEELGPFKSYKTGLKKRKYSWNVENNLLIIDQPVGVGYSFSGKGCYPENETAVGEDLYQAVLQFHQLFPFFQRGKFFISGESYAGHYIPALAYTIYKNNPSSKVKINLSAMMIGDGWVDPVSQIDYADYLDNIGLIDDSEKSVYQNYQEKFVKEVEAGNWCNASQVSDVLMDTLFTNFVGTKISVYNYIQKLIPDRQNWNEYVQSTDVRKALHVGHLPFQSGDAAYQALYCDISKSVKPWVEELLEVYPIIFYNGEVDVICAYPMTINFIRSLEWSGQSQYLNATRSKWCVTKEQAGFFKGVHNLYDVLVRDAGHMVPADQPLWAYELVNSVTSGTADDPLHALIKCDD